jgi:multiple sugar transport system permease protein
VRRARRPSVDRWRLGLGILLGPYLVGATLLIAIPGLLSLALAFTTYDGLTPPVFNGLWNLRFLALDPKVPTAIINTLVLVAVMVPLRIGGAFLLALLLQRRGRGVGTARAAVYLPAVVPDVALALVMVWVFNPLYGPVNGLLGAFGLPQPGWLADASLAKVPFVVMAVFGLGEGFIVLLAARKGIPGELYEAGALEGAGAWPLFRFLTLPLMLPWLALLTVRDVIIGFQWSFVPATVMTGGDPYYATLFLPQLIHEEAFDRFRYGTGSALMLLISLMAAALLAGLWALLQARGMRDARDARGVRDAR